MSSFRTATLTNKTGPVLGFCFIMVLISAIIGELSHTQTNAPRDNLKLRNPIPASTLNSIESIQISNSLGEVQLKKLSAEHLNPNNEKQSNHQDIWWVMTERPLYAKFNLAEKIISSLNSIQVEKVLENDTLNRDYFSLNNPVYSVTINQDWRLSFGLVNTIDNSTYMLVENLSKIKGAKFSDKIYQIKILNFNFQSIDLQESIYTKVFPTSPQDITELELIINRTSRMKIELKNNQWIDKRNRILNQKLVSSYLIDVFSKSIDVLIDQDKENVYEEIDNILKKSDYILKYKNTSGKEYEYRFSYPLRSLPSLNLERRKYIVTRESKNYYPILLDKKFLDYFKMRSRQLR